MTSAPRPPRDAAARGGKDAREARGRAPVFHVFVEMYARAVAAEPPAPRGEPEPTPDGR